MLQRRETAGFDAESQVQAESEVTIAAQSAWQEHQIGYIQKGFTIAAGVGGSSAVVLFIKASYNCVSNPQCADPLLGYFPTSWQAPVLIASGGFGFGCTSAIFGIKAVPAFVKLMSNHQGATKLLVGMGALIGMALTTLEPGFLAIKAYPNMDEALAQWTTWVSIGAVLPMNLYGTVRTVPNLFNKCRSAYDEKRGKFMGKDVSQFHGYNELREEHKQVQALVANRWAALVPRAALLPSKGTPGEELEYLIENTRNQPVSDQIPPRSSCKKALQGVVGFSGVIMTAAIVAPVIKTSASFLMEHDVPEEAAVAGAILIDLGRLLALGEKHWSLRSMVDWSWNQDLDCQLYPIATSFIVLINMALAYFSYAVIKDAALREFTGAYQEIMVALCVGSITASHFSFPNFLRSEVFQLLGNYLYSVKEKVNQIEGMTLEQYYADKQKSLLLGRKTAAQILGFDARPVPVIQRQSTFNPGEVADLQDDPVESAIPVASASEAAAGAPVVVEAPRSSWAKCLCCFFRQKEDDSVKPLLGQPAGSLSARRSGNTSLVEEYKDFDSQTGKVTPPAAEVGSSGGRAHSSSMDEEDARVNGAGAGYGATSTRK